MGVVTMKKRKQSPARPAQTRKKKGLFGARRTAGKTARAKKKAKCKPYTLEEMIFYDWLFEG